MNRMKWLILGIVLVGGCAHQTPEQREAERQKRERCARVEIYPMGVTPPRAYRVLGPVSTWNEVNPALRERKLQQQACDLGADAVIDVKTELRIDETAGGASGNEDTAGTAVAYVADPAQATP